MSERSPLKRLWRRGLLAAALLGLIGLTGYRPGVCLLGLNESCDQPIAAAPVADKAATPASAAAALPPELPAPVVAADAPAPDFGVRQLWELIDTPETAADWEALVSAATDQIHYVTVNQSLLQGKSAVVWREGETLELPLPSGETVAVEIQRTEARGPDRYIVEGTIPGVAESRFLMAVNQQHVTMSLDGLPSGELKLRSLGPESRPLVQLYAVDPALEAHCRTKGPSDYVMANSLNEVTGMTHEDIPSPQAEEPLSSGQAVVDVLITYTSAARASIGSTTAIVNQIDLMFAKVQSDYTNSGISARLRLADTMEVVLPGDDSSSSQADWQSDALDKIAATQDGIMDEVHARRDALGADLVSLIVNRDDPSSRGIAFLMQDMGSFFSPFYAFSVVEISDISDGVVMSHELGHNFGCAHDRENTNGPGTFDYSYGYRISAGLSGGGTGQVRTIMAYSPGNRVRYFSGPENTVTSYTFSGRTFTFAQPVTLGVAEGGTGEADNARTIEQTAFQVANYRLSPDRGAAGRLVNVSTRAWVGSGDQTLIGGFVLNGSGTQRVLIRAPGPALADFNLAQALADTELTVDHIGVGVIAANDDWGLPAANGIAVADAATTAGAFPFANGSLDSGVVMDLGPGNYTARVIGKGGAQGYSLVEVYKVGDGSSAPRLLNLSTRAYADSNRPMIAGFVVNADPGAEDQRKTMFIRVRGPSLTNYGLPASSVMSDPLIEVYDAQSELVFVNDDWDPPSADIDGTSRDGIPPIQRGVVDQLSEQAVHDAAVFASGGAGNDMKPTEPGVVLELPPGLYTVFVMPFEDLPDQPAEPGVAIVEVFEITP
jgi:hypothetical protein